MSEQPSYSLFCMGNPLLDIQVTNGEDILKKYNLKANDAILAGEEHLPMSVFSLFLCLRYFTHSNFFMSKK